MSVAHSRSRLSAPRWMGCPRTAVTESNEIDDNETHKEPLTAAAKNNSQQLIIVPICALVLYITSYVF